MRPLIVDDEVEILSTFSEILQQRGHEVSTAASAYAAKSLLQAESTTRYKKISNRRRAAFAEHVEYNPTVVWV